MSETRKQQRVGDFIVRAWVRHVGSDGDPVMACFEVIRPISFEFMRIRDRPENVESPLFERRGGRGSMDTTEDIEESVTRAHGDVKWDGCTNFVLQDDDGCMAHACGGDDFRAQLDALVAARALAVELLGGERC